MHAFIETLISLVGLYILFSIVNSSIVEVFVQMLNERGKFLKKSLENFFGQAKETSGRMVDSLYDNKLFKAYAKNGKVPDHIDKTLFSRAMMEILFLRKGKTNIDGGLSMDEINKQVFDALPDDLKKTLNLILIKARDQANNKLEYLQNEMEIIFETYMKTVTYWYQKRSKIIMGISGFLLAVLFNLNSIHFYEAFKADSELRRNYVDLSGQWLRQKESLTLDTATVISVLNQQNWGTIKKDSIMNVLVGAIRVDDEKMANRMDLTEMEVGFLRIFSLQGLPLLKALLGSLLTGLALSFGSTFWFSVLKKLFGK